MNFKEIGQHFLAMCAICVHGDSVCRFKATTDEGFLVRLRVSGRNYAARLAAKGLVGPNSSWEGTCRGLVEDPTCEAFSRACACGSGEPWAECPGPTDPEPAAPNYCG